jgi:hypothetical protein
MNQIASTDLWFPGHQAPVGLPPHGQGHDMVRQAVMDRNRYVVWINAGRPHGMLTRAELAPRTALHLVVCRNGAGP